MKLPGRGMSWREFFSALQREWLHDDLSNVAGSVTFSALLAIFPFLIFLVALGSLFLNPESTTSVIDAASEVMPAAAADLLSNQIRSLAASGHGGRLITLSIVAALWAASGGIHRLIGALNTCYGVKETRPYWKVRGLAVVMTIFAAFISLVATAAAVAVPAVAHQLGSVGTVLLWARLPLAALSMMFLWAVLYYALPDVEQEFRFITPGSVTGVLLWVLASWGFSTYVANFGRYEVTYGALGGVIVFLVWMWISAQVLLLGAEINAIIEHKSAEGKRVGAHRMQDSGEDTSKTEHEQAERERPVVVTPPPARPVVRRRRLVDLAEGFAVGALLGVVARRARA